MRFSSDRSGRRHWPGSPASSFWPTRRRRRRLRRSNEGQGRNPPSHRGAEISRSWPGGVPSVGSSCPQPSYSRPHQGGRAIASGDAVAFLSSVIPAQELVKESASSTVSGFFAAVVILGKGNG